MYLQPLLLNRPQKVTKSAK